MASIKQIISHEAFLVASLFLISLIVSSAYLDLRTLPVLFPDSNSYLEIANAIRSLQAPATNIRTLVYPIFLAIVLTFSTLKAVAYAQIISGGITVVFSYLIFRQLSRSTWMSYILALVFAFDFQVISFQPTILTESLSIMILSISIYLHLRDLRQPYPPRPLLGLVLVDLLLIFVRPIFIALPFVLYMVKLLIALLNKEKRYKLYFIAIIINLLFIGSYCYLNQIRYGFFGVTIVSDINMLGKNIQYGYLNEHYDSVPSPYINQALQYMAQNNSASVYGVLDHIGYSTTDMEAANKFFMSHHRVDFIVKTARLIPSVFTASPDYYSSPSRYVADGIAKVFKLSYWLIDQLSFVVSLGAIALAGWWIYNKNINRGLELILILGVIYYTIFTTTALSYGEYARLRSPVALLIDGIVVLPILWAINYARLRLITRETR